MEPPLNCPICGTPFQIHITERTLDSVYYIGERIVVRCGRCDKSDVFTVDSDFPLDVAREHSQQSFAYSLANQKDAQVQRLAIQLASLEHVKASLTNRLIAKSSPFFPSGIYPITPDTVFCRACHMAAESASDIDHIVNTRFNGARFRCPLGALNITIDYLFSIQEQVKGGKPYDDARFFYYNSIG